MKPFFDGIWAGDPLFASMENAANYVQGTFQREKESADTQHLDMIASWMTLADLRGTWFWGSTVGPLLVGPVPRVFWPTKPRLNEYNFELQIPARRMADAGMTSGIVGEGYANFGYFGVALYCFALSAGYSLAFEHTEAERHDSPWKLLYLLLLTVYPQIYRDGLISVVMFPFVYGAPIVASSIAALLMGRSRGINSSPGVGRGARSLTRHTSVRA
jgi:hypothetical protein